MKPSVPLLLLPAIVAAEQAVVGDFSSPLHLTQTPIIALPSTAQTVPRITPKPTSQPLAPEDDLENLPHALKQFILDMTPRSELERRQQAAGGGGGAAGGGVAPGGGVPAAATPTQLSPITTYNIGDGNVIYSQSFASPVDQWSSAAPGTIGLGTISGATNQIGKVKSKNPAPTLAPERMMCAVIAGGVGAAMML